jgi:dihydroxyacetone kinase-like protein
VDDALAGFAAANAAHVSFVPDPGYLTANRPAPGRRVGLVSGGGSGHEPLHAGFVGTGMLDAACPGRVFASPHNRQVYDASRAVAREDGVLHIVKNYTGDRINFGIAAERLAHDGIACARVTVDDDVATDSEDIAVGRRGTGATVLVEKILGAAADQGASLAELTALGNEVAGRSRSIAVAAAAHTAPATGEPAFELETDVEEFGVGIHGERSGRTRKHTTNTELIADLVGPLADALDLAEGAQVIALVNGLGAVTNLELYALYGELVAALDKRGITVVRQLVGSVVTALDMRGVSVSLLRTDERLTALWDAPADTPAWQRA